MGWYQRRVHGEITSATVLIQKGKSRNHVQSCRSPCPRIPCPVCSWWWTLCLWPSAEAMKKIVTYLENNGRAGEVDTFKKNINGYMKDVLGRFKDLQFFVGESMDNDAMIMIMDYKDYKGEERPFLIAFKHGLEEEKV